MSKRSQDKRRARSKEKKQARRRLQGSSPLSRLADEQHCECWMNASPDLRMVGIQALRPVRGGQSVGAFFLIDRDCIGLKDAFYRLDIDPIELREAFRRRAQSEDMRVERIGLEETRRYVAAAIRWTREHPFFRMPADTERCVKILGGVGDIDAADVSDFGVEGKLFYVGRKIDLAPRLVGMTVEEFMERDDVDCEFHMGDETFGPFEDDEEFEEEEGDFLEEEEVASLDEVQRFEEELLVMREKLKHKMLDAVRRWCFAKAIMPQPDLEAAIELSLEASLATLGEEDETAAGRKAQEALTLLESFEDPARKEALHAAEAQFQQFVDSFPSKEAYLSAIGFDNPET